MSYIFAKVIFNIWLNKRQLDSHLMHPYCCSVTFHIVSCVMYPLENFTILIMKMMKKITKVCTSFYLQMRKCSLVLRKEF